jgi:hypothetical protein
VRRGRISLFFAEKADGAVAFVAPWRIHRRVKCQAREMNIATSPLVPPSDAALGGGEFVARKRLFQKK